MIQPLLKGGGFLFYRKKPELQGRGVQNIESILMCNDAGAKLWVDNSGLQNRLPYACFVVGQRPHTALKGGGGWLSFYNYNIIDRLVVNYFL